MTVDRAALRAYANAASAAYALADREPSTQHAAAFFIADETLAAAARSAKPNSSTTPTPAKAPTAIPTAPSERAQVTSST